MITTPVAKTKVDQLYHQVFVEQHVFSLNVAVGHSFRMQIGNGISNRSKNAPSIAFF